MQIQLAHNQKGGVRHIPHNQRQISTTHADRRHERPVGNLRKNDELEGGLAPSVHGNPEALLCLPQKDIRRAQVHISAEQSGILCAQAVRVQASVLPQRNFVVRAQNDHLQELFGLGKDQQGPGADGIRSRRPPSVFVRSYL